MPDAAVVPSQPVLHLVVGPNGAGKSTLYARAIEPVTHLELINADVIAAQRFPGEEEARSYEAAEIAAQLRADRIRDRRSFVAETVFSHPSKVDLVRAAETALFRVSLHVVMIPEDLAVARVSTRVANGGHAVPEEKIRERYQRIWGLVVEAISLAHDAFVYDNSRAADPFRLVATFEAGSLVGEAAWPGWTPPDLLDATR